MSSSLNKDMEEVYEFYVQSLIEMIGEQHAHIGVAELRSIWKDIKKPAHKKKQPSTDHDREYDKRKRQLENMRYEDLYRHCVRNGLQPPPKKEDMVRIIMTRILHSS